jgi:hypothetical protein
MYHRGMTIGSAMLLLLGIAFICGGIFVYVEATRTFSALKYG